MEFIAGYVSSLIPFISGAIVSLISLMVIRKSRKNSRLNTVLRGDDLLIATAITEVDNDPAKVTYLEVAIKMELQRLTEIYTKANKYRVILGSVYLVTGFISIAITGTNAAIPGFLDTVKFSFAVNIVGEIASGFLIFGGFEGKVDNAMQAASLIRLEVSQFIGQSAEYFNQKPETRWFLLTQSVEAILIRAIAFDTVAKKTDKKDGEDEEDGENDAKSPVVPTIDQPDPNYIP